MPLSSIDLAPLVRHAFEREPIMEAPTAVVTVVQTPTHLILVLRVPTIAAADIGIEVPLPMTVGDARWVAWSAAPDDVEDWVRLSILIPVTELIETGLSRAQRIGDVDWLPTDMFELG